MTLAQIQGLHHVTSIGSKAGPIDRYFVKDLGFRRVKKTVNFDAPDVYHLYYGDYEASPGSLMTYFPFPHAKRGLRGYGEVTEVCFRVEGKAGYEAGPDGDGFQFEPSNGTPGLAGVTLGVHPNHLEAMHQLMALMNFRPNGERLICGPHYVTFDTSYDQPAQQGAGSVHHVAFAVEDREAQAEVAEGLRSAGMMVTEVKDRDYFYAIYFRTPAGILFEVATREPGFTRDEPLESLGEGLMLPSQHAHLRDQLEARLEPLP